MMNHDYTICDIITFTYYHCTYIDYSVHCEWVHCTLNILHSITLVVLCYYKCKGNSPIIMITVQSSSIVLLRSTVDYHLIKCSWNYYVNMYHMFLNYYVNIVHVPYVMICFFPYILCSYKNLKGKGFLICLWRTKK